MLTQKRLMELLDYNPETGVFRWRVPRTNRVKPGQVAGYRNNLGYVSVVVDGKGYLAHRLAWLYIHGYFPENEIDHIDRNPNNNRIANLREVSRQCNLRNCKKRIDNQSGITGVGWAKREQRWRARINVNHNDIHIGYYKTRKKAAFARWEAEKKHGYPNCNTTSSAYNFIRRHKIAEAQ